MRAVIQQQNNGVHGPGRANAEGEKQISRDLVFVGKTAGSRLPPEFVECHLEVKKVETMFYYRRGLCLCDWLIGVPT